MHSFASDSSAQTRDSHLLGAAGKNSFGCKLQIRHTEYEFDFAAAPEFDYFRIGAQPKL